MDQTQQVLPTSYPTPQPKPTKTAWVLIGLFYFILVGVACYFGYQYYRLKQQLALPKKSLPSAQTTNTPSPSPTTNSTTSWRTYDDNQNKFSFKYPNSWQDFPLNTVSNDVTELMSLETDLIAYSLSQDAGPDHATQDPKIVFKIIKFINIDDIDAWVQGRRSNGELHAKVANTYKINNNQFTEVVGLGTVGGCTKNWFLRIPSGGYLSFTLDPYSNDCSATSNNTSIDEIVRQVLNTFDFHL